MFDLFRSREKSVRYLLGGLLMVVAVSMVITLIPGYGSSTASANSTTIAEIGKEPLTIRDVQKQMEGLLRNKQIPAELASVYVPQMVDQMISERAGAYEAKRLGFEVTDAELADIIRSLPQIKDLTPEQYKMFLEQQGFSVQEFESNLRKNTLLLRIRNLALEGVVVTPAEVEQEYKSRNEKIKLQYIAFNPATLKAKMSVDPAELQSWFAKNKSLFSVPEKRSYDVIVVDQTKVAETMQTPETQLRAFYDSNRDRFRTPERVQVRHILIKTTGKSPDEVKQLQTKAQDLLKQLKGGADFGQLAKKNSEDPGSAAKDGDLGWIVRGQTVKNFEDTAFSLKPKELSNVITTEYGFHILQVLAKETARLRPFEEVKGEIAAEIQKQGLFDRMQNLADQARAELAKNPQGAEEIAKKLNLIYTHADKVKQGEAIPLIGSDPAFDQNVLGLKKNEVSQVMQLPGNRLAVAAVREVQPPHAADLADVQQEAKSGLLDEKAQKLAQDKAKQAIELLKTNGGDLAAAAKATGGELKTTDLFSRNGAAEGLGSASYLGEGFNKPTGAWFGPVSVTGQTIVAKVIDKVGVDTRQITAAIRDEIVLALKAKKAQEREQLVMDSILAKLIQEGKVKIHKDVINRLIAGYQR